MTPPEVRVSPDGTVLAFRWPEAGDGQWACVQRDARGRYLVGDQAVHGWPKMLAQGVPQGQLQVAVLERAALQLGDPDPEDGHPT